MLNWQEVEEKLGIIKVFVCLLYEGVLIYTYSSPGKCLVIRIENVCVNKNLKLLYVY